MVCGGFPPIEEIGQVKRIKGQMLDSLSKNTGVFLDTLL